MTAMVQRGCDWQHWNWRGDLVATSDATGTLTPAVCDWNKTGFMGTIWR